MVSGPVVAPAFCNSSNVRTIITGPPSPPVVGLLVPPPLLTVAKPFKMLGGQLMTG
jgi:hypothetical protein